MITRGDEIGRGRASYGLAWLGLAWHPMRITSSRFLFFNPSLPRYAYASASVSAGADADADADAID